MMTTYYVKPGAELYGVPDRSVERFHVTKGEPLVAQGKLERFDEKNKEHVAARTRQEEAGEKRRLAGEALLREERENPAASHERERQRRARAETAQADRLKEVDRELKEQEGRRQAH